jgi:hypothetical protein
MKTEKKLEFTLFITRFGIILFCSFILAKVITVDKYNYILSKEVVCLAHEYVTMLYTTITELRDGLVSTKELLFKDQAIRDSNAALIEEVKLLQEETRLLVKHIETDSYEYAKLLAQNDVLRESKTGTSWFATVTTSLGFGLQLYNLFGKGEAPAVSLESFTQADRSVLKLVLDTLTNQASGVSDFQVHSRVMSLNDVRMRDD